MKARKKPVEVEVRKLESTDESIKEAMRFLTGKNPVGLTGQLRIENIILDGGILIETLEGDMLAEFDDYIIKGVNGEFYPCKPDVFHKTYDIVEEVSE